MGWAVQRVHYSWLTGVVSLSFVVGVSLSLLTPASMSNGVWLLTSLVVGVFCFFLRQPWTIPLLVIAGMVGGVWLGSITEDERGGYVRFYGQFVQLEGLVIDDADTDKSGATVLKLKNIRIDTTAINAGVARVTTKSSSLVRRGDTVKLEGVLGEGFGTYPASMHRATLLSVHEPQPPDIARIVRDWFTDGVRQAVPDPQARLGIGFLVGQKSALPPDLLEALQIAGLTHIVVASGYNLTILVRLSRRLLARVSVFSAFIGSILLVVCMMAVTGLSPSMTRAGLVTGMSLLVWYYGRSFHPFVLLPFAAALTVFVEPSYAWGDMGWLLSFSAFAGVMILAPLLQRFFFGETQSGILRQVLGETIAAHFMTLPIIIVSFGTISNVAVFANLMIVPLVPLAMLLTFMAGVGTLLSPLLAELVGQPATWLLGYMVAVSEWWAMLPWAQFEVQVEWWFAPLAYIIMACVIGVLWRVTKFSMRQQNIVE